MYTIFLEGVEPYLDKQGRPYYMFGVRLIILNSPIWIATSGWRYWPEKDSLASPSINKGNNKFFNSVKVPIELYNQVKDEIRRALGVVPQVE